MKLLAGVRYCDRGFTLVELLVAMTLLGLLTIVLSGSLHFGTRVWERSEGAMSGEAKIRSLQLTLAEDISRIYPLAVKGGAARSQIAFIGSRNKLFFMTMDPANSGEILRVSIQTERNANGTVLTRTTGMELAAAANDRKTILLSHVKSLDISYYGPTEASGVPAWQASWIDRTTLPKLIRISMTLTDGAVAAWPDLVVAPRIVADVGCVFDPLTKFCRGL